MEEYVKEFLDDAEVVNETDKEYTNGNLFLLAIGSHGEHKFAVYASHLQEALEILGEYCKTKGYTGLLEFDYDTLLEFYDGSEDYVDENYFPVNGGEYYLSMPGYVKEVTID